VIVVDLLIGFELREYFNLDSKELMLIVGLLVICVVGV